MAKGILKKGIVNLGGKQFSHVGVTSNYTIEELDYVVEGTSGTFDITLKTVLDDDGKIYIIKNSGEGIITLKTSNNEKIGTQDKILFLNKQKKPSPFNDEGLFFNC